MLKPFRQRSYLLLVLITFIVATTFSAQGQSDGITVFPLPGSTLGSSPKVPVASTLPDVQVDTQTRQALLEQVQADGQISVIVGFNAPYSPQSARDAASEAAQQVGIDGLRNALVASILSTGDAEVISDSTRWAIPFVAMNVDEAAYQALLASPNVTSISENHVNEAHLTNTTLLTGATQLWSLGENGAGQTVAILDVTPDTSHPALAGRVVAEACYSGAVGTTYCPNLSTTQVGTGAASPTRCTSLYTGANRCFHGTHVAGIAAGNHASQNVYGVARGANIIAVNVFSKTPENTNGAYDSDIIAGLNYVYSLRFTYSIAAFNMSLGGGAFSAHCDSTTPAMTTMFSTLRTAGIMPVVSTGNDGNTTGISYPGCISTAVSVGATTLFDQRASFSNSLPSITSLFAPGFLVYSAVPLGSIYNNGLGYAQSSGTSMAAPHVAGAFALLRDAVPSATGEQILTALRNTGIPITVPGGTTPRIDLMRAYNQLMSLPLPTPTPANTPTVVNDQSAGAITNGPSPYQSIQPDIYHATMTGDPSVICGSPVTNVVWYRVLQNSGISQAYQIDTFQTPYDTVMGLYLTPGGAEYACNDDLDTDNGIYVSGVIVIVPSGTPIYIAIGKYETHLESPMPLHINIFEASGSPVPVPGRFVFLGRIALQGRPPVPDPKYIQTVHVILRAIDGGAAVFNGNVTTDRYGNFMIPNLPSGTFNVWVKQSHALAQRGIVGISRETGFYFTPLLEGDANNDNLITLPDFSILASTFGKASGDGGYDARADFNGDGVVTITDFSLLASNFGLSGAAMP